MKFSDCIMTPNGITCFYNNNLLNNLLKFTNHNNIANIFTSKYIDYYIGYVTLRFVEIIIGDIVSNLKDIKNIENTSFIFN